MKTIACLAAVSLMTLSASPLSFESEVVDNHRFLVEEHGKFGFIDSSGKIAIKPIYEMVHKFSEGLAAVRVSGRYGFIDVYGNIVIAPAYDYATEFREGLAFVYNDGKAMCIDGTGNIAFKTSYVQATIFKNGRSLTLTASKKMGCIDRSGSLVVDTVYSAISQFKDGLAVAWQFSDRHGRDKVCIIDESGKVVVPFGKYSDIQGPFDGRFYVQISRKRGKESIDAVLDSRGWITYQLNSRYIWFDQKISNGIMIAAPAEEESDESDYSFMTFKGELIYDRDVDLAYDFNENFGFYRNENNKYSFINRQGKVIAQDVYDDIVEPGFTDGMALVKEDDKWGLIDTTGAYILKPQLKSVYGIANGYVITMDESDTTSYYPKYGLVDLDGKTIIPPVLQQLNLEGFTNGLLSSWTDDRLTYFDTEGNIAWQQSKEEEGDLRPLNIDFMNRGYFYVDGVNTGHSIAGRATSNEKVTMRNSFQGAALSVVSNVDVVLEHVDNIKGLAVFVANTTGDTIRFSAQDGRLYMKMQAKDPTGVWRDIEYLPRSWCGNSYHSLSLAPNEYWQFTAPVYEGNFNTKLRIELEYVDPASLKKNTDVSPYRSLRSEKHLVIYSNTFDGSINLAQFWRMPGYSANGIMDPYNE